MTTPGLPASQSPAPSRPRLPGGAAITDEGAPVSRLWFLIDGRAAVEIGSGAGRTLVATLEPGAVLGEASYLSGRGATASVTTLCECRLIEFPSPTYDGFVKSNQASVCALSDC